MLNLVLFGPPGSGKGTYSVELAKKYNLKHLSTGDIFRSEIKNETKLGLEAKAFMDKGQLVPDELVVRVLLSVVDSSMGQDGFIFDGFPRTIPQAEQLDAALNERKMPVSLVVSLDVTEEELIKRLLKRGAISGRADDNLEVIQDRLEVYKKQTQPLIHYYEQQQKLTTIYGIGEIPKILSDICNEIDKYLKK